MAKIEPFERYTGQYEDWFLKNRFVYRSELKAIKEQLPEGKRGIEIGVGTGQFGAPLGIDIGIEPSHKMGGIARKRGIKVIDAVAESLPLRNSSHDFILMVTTICFLDDIMASFKEIYRVLKVNGEFLFWDLTIPKNIKKKCIYVIPIKVQIKNKKIITGYGTRWNKEQNLEYFIDLIKKVGFTFRDQKQEKEYFFLRFQKG